MYISVVEHDGDTVTVSFIVKGCTLDTQKIRATVALRFMTALAERRTDIDFNTPFWFGTFNEEQGGFVVVKDRDGDTRGSMRFDTERENEELHTAAMDALAALARIVTRTAQ